MNIDDENILFMLDKELVDYSLEDATYPWNYIVINETDKDLKKNFVGINNTIFIKHALKYPFLLKYKKVILLDDDSQETALIKAILTNLGMYVKIVSTFKEMEEVIKDYKPDIFLIDFYLNNEKGDKVLKEIKSSPEFFDTPAVVISGSENKDDIIASLEAGANDFIKKPFFIEELVARISAQLRIKYIYDELVKHLEKEEILSRKLSDLLEEIRVKNDKISSMNKMLKMQVITDPLTEVFNRRYLFEILKREIARVKRYNESLSVIMIDIDHFKKINDNYGHMVGDKVLKGIAKVLKERIRTSDIIARYGGEEFVVILTNADINVAKRIAEELRQKVENLVFKIDDKSIKTTISLGVSQLKPEDDIDSLLIRADENLYAAKNKGRNMVIIG